jgi:predicted nucleic acid-binding protein
MLIIADSSALVALALCDGLPLLDRLFDDIKVPQSVFEEVIVKGKPAAEILQTYLKGKAIQVDKSHVILTPARIGVGELEAMALYKTLHADYLLVDDQRARKIARLNHITIIGSLGILLLAKHTGHIAQVRPFVERLGVSDIYVSERLMQKILRLAGESD